MRVALATNLLLSILVGAGVSEGVYHYSITERVTESGMLEKDFRRFELIIEDRNDLGRISYGLRKYEK